MPTPKVIDLSHYNAIPQSLKPAYAAGVRGVVHKATEGMGALDVKAGARMHLAREANLLWGLYHFMRPGDAKAQAENFLRATAAISDANTLLVCDYEVAAVPLTDVSIFLDTIVKLTGKWPVLYSGNTLKEAVGPTGALTAYRLWLAQYSNTYKLPAGFDKYWLWQYSEQGVVDGITAPTDVSAYNGDDTQLAQDWIATNGVVVIPNPPTPPVTPPEATFGIALAVPQGATVQVFVNGDMVFHGVSTNPPTT